MQTHRCIWNKNRLYDVFTPAKAVSAASASGNVPLIGPRMPPLIGPNWLRMSLAHVRAKTLALAKYKTVTCLPPIPAPVCHEGLVRSPISGSMYLAEMSMSARFETVWGGDVAASRYPP